MVMRCFGGTRTASGLPLVPEGSRLLRVGREVVWMFGDWADDQVRVLEGPGWWCAVLGDVVAGDAELARQARRFASRLDDTPLAARGGSSHVVWADDHETIVTGDQAGTQLVFHADYKGVTHFASSATILADLLGSDPDPTWLGLRLASRDLVPSSSRSAFDSVMVVPADGSLLLDNQRRARTAALRRPSPTTSFADGAGALREAMLDEIRPFLGAGTTADLSGGLDSTAVAAVASRESAQPVTALTLDSAQPDNDDVERASMAAALLSNVQHETRVIPDAVLPYTAIDAAPATDEPWTDAVLHARTAWWHTELLHLGSRAHLTGDGGDAVLVGPLTYLADFARHPASLVREARGWATLRNSPTMPVIAAALRLAATSPDAALASLTREVLRPAPRATSTAAQVRWFDQPNTAWLTEDARRAVADAIRECRLPKRPGWSVGDRAARSAVTSFARQQRLDQQAADINGLRLVSPYLHDGVVTAGLSVPASERTTVHAAKPLLRAALSGLVPDGLLSRSTKGNYSALHYRGIARNMDLLHDLLTGSRLADMGLLDASSARQTLTQAGRGVDVPLARLASVVAAEVWYRAHERRTRTRWTPVREDKACLATSWPLTSP